MTALTRAQKIDWLRLARTDNVGPVTFAFLLKRHGDAGRALRALPALQTSAGARAGRVPSADEAEARTDGGRGARRAADLFAAIRSSPAPWRRSTRRRPCSGRWATRGCSSRPCVAIVGARIASAAGQRFARTLAGDLGEAGFVVVSGLARGIDAAAHEGALPSGTVAVLAGGVDDIYPPEHRALHGEIARLGCVVSERPIGHNARAARLSPPQPDHLRPVARVVVVEAELRSGSLITARLADEQGREVFAVPGSPLDPRSRGTNDLIRQGATLVEEAADVIRVLEAQSSVAEPRGAGAGLVGRAGRRGRRTHAGGDRPPAVAHAHRPR